VGGARPGQAPRAGCRWLTGPRRDRPSLGVGAGQATAERVRRDRKRASNASAHMPIDKDAPLEEVERLAPRFPCSGSCREATREPAPSLRPAREHIRPNPHLTTTASTIRTEGRHMDLETFLVSLYVVVDEWWKRHPLRPLQRLGRPPALTEAEVLTLAILAQWPRFRSERDFHRFAQAHLRPYFPSLVGQSHRSAAHAPSNQNCDPCSGTWPSRSPTARRSTG
jgi:hypothetical protein